MAAKYPTRQAQDLIATRVRAARIFARFAVCEAGGVGAAAYLAALQASVAPPKTASGKPVGSVFRGCASRPAAGLRTFDALDLLERGLAAEAAQLDLDCDPGCLALHAARDALIVLLAEGKGSAADLDARDACRDYDREVGLGVAALLDVVPTVVRQGRAVWGKGLCFEDAVGVGLDGLYTAISRYRLGDVALVSYCSWGRAGAQYILKAVAAAMPLPSVNIITVSENNHMEDKTDEALRASAVDHFRSPSYEEQITDAEILRDREALAASVIAAGAEVVEAKAAKTGKETSATHGVRALAHHHTPPPKDFGSAVRVLRNIYRTNFATCRPALTH